MSDYKNDLVGLLRKALNLENFIPVKHFDATVISVNKSDRTCVVNSLDQTIDGLTVRYAPTICEGTINVPSVNETVIVMIGGIEPYITSHSWIDEHIITVGNQGFSNDGKKQIFNDGGYNGLVRVDPLVAAIKEIKDDINNLKNILSSWIVVPSDGGAALFALLSTYKTSLLAATTVDDLENKSITHGDKLST